MSIGFRILPRRRKVSTELVQAFRPLPVSNVSDVMARMSGTASRLQPMHAGSVMAGPALTVKTRPGDNLMVHKAIDMADPGDVIVVDAGGDLTNAIIGEMMLAQATQRGVAGFVIDGSIRDVAAVRTSETAVYAAGVTHRGPYKNGPGEINCAVSVGGMIVNPGDLILGDADGVVCVPIDGAELVLADARTKHEAEVQQMAKIVAGSLDRRWVDETLTRLGCAVVKD